MKHFTLLPYGSRQRVRTIALEAIAFALLILALWAWMQVEQ